MQAANNVRGILIQQTSSRDDDQLRKFRSTLSERGLIIVSNREPYVHKRIGGKVRVDIPVGGLTAAMDDVMKQLSGTWVAWGSGNADADTVDTNSIVMVPPDDPLYKLKRVWIKRSEAENYYHGFSNSVLWPLCHFTLDMMYYRKRYWNDYRKINRRFSEAVLEEAGPDSFVWIHDYHLCLLPKLLKSARPDLVISHFWHIPWPSFSVFRACPNMEEVLKGLLANDLIGFQIELFANYFLECAQEVLGAKVDSEKKTVTFNGHTTCLKALPISIDFAKFEDFANSPRAVRMLHEIPRKHNIDSRFIGIGVDRLEYTKGLLKRLEALDLFFHKNVKLRGEFTFIQVAVPTRTHEPYTSYKRSLEAYIEKINRKYEFNGWKTIVYIADKLDHAALSAYYRLADVAIISSIYDGMNLVAKEYVASQVDEKGVLLLSDFCGAADELEGSIPLNPYDIQGFAEAIKRALLMSSEEKSSRMMSLRSQIRSGDVHAWVASVMEGMIEVSRVRSERIRYFFDNINTMPRKDVMLFLDYDGTLAPIVDKPEDASFSDETRLQLQELSTICPVAVVSGRKLKDIKQRVGIQGILYVGNHGAEIWNGEDIVFGGSTDTVLLHKVRDKLKSAMSGINGAIVEDKRYSLSVHYRLVDEDSIGELHRRFWNVMDRYEDSFRITSGKKVMEVRPKGIWHKGDVVLWLAQRFGKGKTLVYVGDDITDVDAFRALRDVGIAVSIGVNAEADLFLKDQAEINDFLKVFINQED